MSEYEPSEHVETVCQHCVFAEWDLVGGDEHVAHEAGESEFKTIQVDCECGMLEVYQKQGITFNQYDIEDKVFYGIPGRICQMRRNKEWQRRQPDGEDLIGIARDELTLRMDVIIYIDKDGSFSTTGKTLDSLVSGNIKPNQVVFIDHANIRPSLFRSWISGRAPVSWRVEHIREKCNLDRCIDIAAKKIRTQFFTVFHAGQIVPKNFISDIDVSLHDNMNRFVLLRPIDEDQNGLVVQTIAYKKVGGFREDLVMNKLSRIAGEQECQNLIQDVKEVVKF